MPRIAYTVAAEVPDRVKLDQYIQWLTGGHIGRVLHFGAQSATVVRRDHDLPDDPFRIEVRYIFPTRRALEIYLRQHAPVLRAEGLAMFPPEFGIRFERTIGEIVE